MKLKNNRNQFKAIKVSIILLLFLTISLFGCRNSIVEVVDYEVLVVPETFKGAILIFYEQDKDLGRCEFRDGKHYFYVDTSGVFFTTKKMGKGVIESVTPDLQKNIFVSSMSINEEPNQNRFVVVGGAYRGFKSKLYYEGKKFVNFTVYKAGQVRTLRDGSWYVNDSLVQSLYEKSKK